MKVRHATWCAALGLAAGISAVLAQAPAPKPAPAPPAARPTPPASSPRTTPAVPLTAFLNVLSDDPAVAAAALDDIGDNWDNSHTVMLLELAQFVERPDTRLHLYDVIFFHTGQRFGPGTFGSDTARGFEWVWNQDFGTPGNYPEFKAELYSREDPAFRPFFSSAFPSRIRLDEIRWGGVELDEIPALHGPKLLTAAEANYLQPNNLVFGVELHGEARAYPKRILGWHELVTDTLGGDHITGVYCTLSGAMVVYKSHAGGVQHRLHNSGFLYRSAKLMYDEDTKSLWSVLTGRPVVGRLAEKDIELERLPVVTTTWAEWRRRHPTTKVLALETGHARNYAEGAAHREYFANDELLFPVPKLDRRLPNKTEVLALRFEEAPGEQLALPGAFLYRNPLHQGKLGPVEFVVLTDASGANRVYETKGQTFASWDRQFTVVDKTQRVWQATESALTSKSGQTLPRLPAHRVFWFAWHAQYPGTRLFK
jgi:hypothetical protein